MIFLFIPQIAHWIAERYAPSAVDAGVGVPLNWDPQNPVDIVRPFSPIVRPGAGEISEPFLDFGSYVIDNVVDSAIRRGGTYGLRMASLVAESSTLTWLSTLGKGGLRAIPFIGWGLVIWDIYDLLDDLGVPVARQDFIDWMVEQSE